MSHAHRNRRPVRAALGSVVGLLAAAVCPALAQSDDDQTVPTGWWYIVDNVDAGVIADRVDQGYRLIDLEIVDTSPLLYNGLFVRNTGEYAKGWYWLPNVDWTTLTDFVDTHNVRIIDLERFVVNGQVRYAAVMILNTGEDAAGWWWLVNVPFDDLNSFLGSNPARIIDLETWVDNGQRRWAAAMIQNTGDHGKGWWWYTNVTPSQIADLLNDNNARLIDMEVRDPAANTYAVVMQERENVGWWWYWDVSRPFLEGAVAQNGARLIDVEKYFDPSYGTTRYSAVMVNNSNPVTSTVGEILRDGTDGVSGLYLKRINGPVLAALQSDYIFEPASMIKALHHAHVLRQVDLGLDTLPGLNLVPTGLTGSCPNGANSVWESLATSLNLMMTNSDNARTDWVRNFFGEANINNTADLLGMDDSLLQHKIGCAGGVDGAIAEPNQLTLEDAGRLYEGVATGFLSPAMESQFFSLMSNGVPGAVSTIIDQEGLAAGLTPNQIDWFKAQAFLAWKGGSYTFIFGGGGVAEHQTRGGYARWPVRAACSTREFEYTFGTFVNDATNETAAATAASTAFWELLRNEIARACESFDSVCIADWNFDGVIDVFDLLAYLDDWFAGHRGASLDGARPVDVFDLLAYLDEWFQG